MIAGIPTETFPGEKRVALVPTGVAILKKKGLDVVIEANAGAAAGFPDEAYREKGAEVVESRAAVFSKADVVLQVRGFGANPEKGKPDLANAKKGQVYIGFMEPLTAKDETAALAKQGVTSFAMELVPRITRAQSMDALSSMANLAGYKSVILAADHLPKIFPMMMTAAGTIVAAKVFIVGVGVAGLQAIATARRLGAIVHAYDIRPAVKEQVQSLGGKFVEMDLGAEDAETKGGYAKAMDEEFYRKQRKMMTKVVAESDVVITTAAVPGKKAPILVTEEMIRQMQPKSVIVDLAAERGGNCEGTEPGKVVEKHGVTIVGTTNIPADLPYNASQAYSKNITNFVALLVKDGALEINMDDEILAESIVTRDGEIANVRVKESLGLP